MKKILLILGLLLISSIANAQSQRNPCFLISNGNCTPVGINTSGVGNGPLPVGGIASAAAKTFIEGMVGGLSFDLSGNLRVIGSGSTTVVGTASNASSGVATSATNVPTVSYNYGFNGTTWDQFQVDTNKYLKVTVPSWAGGVLGAMANYGTSPGAVLVPGVNAFVTNMVSSNTAQVNGVTTLTGTGATGTGAQRVTVATDQATNAGAALVKGGVGVANGGNYYVTVAASQTAQVLQSSTGATGDYLSHCILQPTTTAAGTMTILDNATVIFTFTTGTLSNLASISIPIGAVSRSGAWKVTTGASETVTCFGSFS